MGLLAEFESDLARSRQLLEEIESYSSEQLLWLRNSPPVGLETLTQLPSAFGWTFSPDRLADLGNALWWTVTVRRTVTIVVGLLVVLLVVLRRRLVSALEETGVGIRRISTDRFSRTLWAILWSALLAAPIPLVFEFLAFAFAGAPASPDWLIGFAIGLHLAAVLTFAAGFWVETCRPGGIGGEHFGWHANSLERARQVLWAFPIAYVPTRLITMSFLYGRVTPHFDSIGRLSIVVGELSVAFATWWLLRPSDGILSQQREADGGGMPVAWQRMLLAVLVLVPIGFVGLALRGYTITASSLGATYLATLFTLASGLFLYALVRRWFALRLRRRALAEALRRRAERRARSEESDEEEPTDVVGMENDEETEIDFDTVGAQTQTLLRLVVGFAVVSSVLSVWSDAVPVERVLNAIAVPLTGGRTALDVVQALLVVVVTYVAVVNLPGLLEAAVSHSPRFDAGGRYALATIFRYALAAIGMVLLFVILRIDTANLAWIAAALSVGLGFGLQEVVANFVCGLVLLLERPIRLGDVVTVDDMTGTVTRIRMRATTITNWDRQEFVIPNKTLITGNLLNWTLSAAVTRVTVPVGVAYGSDTDQARKLLLEIAAEHPKVLEEPPPMATFEAFADSSLTLRLFAYLPDVGDRLATITELHSMIDKRFAEAGIEIAFPQRDLHLRTIPESNDVPGFGERGGSEKWTPSSFGE